MKPPGSVFHLLAAGCLVALASCDSSAGPTKPPEVASIRVTPETASVEVGATEQFSATLLDADGQIIAGPVVSWVSSDPGIAAVTSTGLVTGIAAGGPVTVSAISEGKTGTASVTVTGTPVAGVEVTPEALYMHPGSTFQLTATVLDAGGNQLTNRGITWTSSNPGVVSVDASGLARGEAEGGPVTVMATSEGVSAAASLTVTSTVLTGIRGIEAFLDGCPTEDPVYAQLREDFDVRVDGQSIVDPISCTEPYPAMPIEELSDPLIVIQTFRAAYYMSQGMEGHLPWTDQGLYAWMAAYVDGVNLKSEPGRFYCCDEIDGKKYVAQSLRDAEQREYLRSWRGIANNLAYYAHEIRHADPTGGQGHTTGCEAFPLPTDPAGCDPDYDPSNLGSYGIQYWLILGWATGHLNVGIGCSDPQTAAEYVSKHVLDLNLQYRRRFVDNAPSVVTVAPPFGGPCVPSGEEGPAPPRRP